MRFATLTYFLFLALVFVLYWSSDRQRLRNALLLVASYAFYSWWDYRYTALMLISSLTDYWVGQGLVRTDSQQRRRLLLAISLLVNLGMLGFFKYHGFFLENARVALEAAGWRAHLPTLSIVLPVGISFYTFQTMSYTIDIYRRNFRPHDSLIDYMAYVSFFPQLVAGPIERASHLLPQFQSARVFSLPLAEDGLRQILWGLFKKLALADNLAMVVDACYGSPTGCSGAQLAFATVCFAFQIYCDFSAYSDIAIGSARLFGIDLMRNFAYPYFSQSVIEFWRRWHISLSTWFRDYVYIPLGGNRVSTVRRSLNVFVTFVISGFWHGANWTFVVWGALHGLAFVVTPDRTQKAALKATDTPAGPALIPNPFAILRILAVFAFVCVTWVFFRAPNVSAALQILHRIVTEPVDGDLLGGIRHLMNVGRTTTFLALGLMATAEWLQRREAHPLQIASWPRPLRWLVYTALIWSSLFLAPVDPQAFIYFQF